MSSISSIADRNSFQENGQAVHSSPENNGAQGDFQEIQHASGERQLKLKELSLTRQKSAQAAVETATRSLGASMKEIADKLADKLLGGQRTTSVIQRAQLRQVESPWTDGRQITNQKFRITIEGRDMEVVVEGGVAVTRPRQILGSQGEIEAAVAEGSRVV